MTDLIKRPDEVKESEIIIGVRVKLNATAEIRLLSDKDFQLLKKEMKTLDAREKKEKIAFDYPLETRLAMMGEIVDLPFWFWNANKDREITQSISLEIYKDTAGNLMPFNTAEALKFEKISDPTQFTHKVKIFELIGYITEEMDEVEENNIKNKKEKIK